MLRAKAREQGMVPMREYGWRKVIDGQTTIEEVIAVTAGAAVDAVAAVAAVGAVDVVHTAKCFMCPFKPSRCLQRHMQRDSPWWPVSAGGVS